MARDPGPVDPQAGEPDVTRRYAPIIAHHPASRRGAAKSGHVREALLSMSIVKGGRVIDCVQYAACRPRSALARPSMCRQRRVTYTAAMSGHSAPATSSCRCLVALPGPALAA